jgi:hypothetical protein
MLKNTFVHIQGVGEKTEQKLWEYGILQWDDFKETQALQPLRLRCDLIKNGLQESIAQYKNMNPNFFSTQLSPCHLWRMFPEFRDSTAYLDIETNGLDIYSSAITTIALYDGRNIAYYVNGQNLHEFKQDIQRYKVIVSYNGKCFDAPFIERYLSVQLNQAHIDLRYILRDMGFKGGLKACENALGIERGDLEGVDGFFAVTLWNEYRKTKNPSALETLLAYNIEDVVNLETLMILAYNMNLKKTPFVKTHYLTIPKKPRSPFFANKRLIQKMKQRHQSMFQ